MKVIYTKHAEEKLHREDVKKFKISKLTIEKILEDPESLSKTKYGDYSALGSLDKTHVLRVIFVIIEDRLKVITFHIARKGRYEN